MKRIRNILLLVVVFIATVFIVPMAAGAATSDRILPASVDPGATFSVSMTVADYGSGGSVAETLPDGFTYLDSTLGDTQAEYVGNTVTFTLFDESSFDYTVLASGINGTCVFSGVIKDSYKVESTVGGDTSITVGADAGDGLDASATRTLPATSVDSGATFTVSMTVADYGSGGSLVETLPDGFTYVNSTLGDTQAEEAGNTVIFTLFDESSFDYTVEASGTDGTYVFSGIIKDSYKDDFTVGGDTSITVGEDRLDASATRTLPATSVEPGATFTVSMTVADYGSGGSLVETLPDGFTYVDSTLGDTQAEEAGNTVIFTLFDESSFDYTVEASSTDGTYAFSGIIKDSYKVDFAVTGDSSIDVVTPPMDIPLKEGWNFISIPCVLENSSIDGVLAGVSYNSPLLYYNAETSVWDTALTFEPLKGYWINVSAADQVILEDSLVKQEIQDSPAPQPQIQIYEGWNAIGSNYEYAETAEKTLMSIDAKYAKIDDGYGLIALNGEDYEDAEDGTENFIMYPYNGYWVFVTLDGVLG